MSEEAESKTVLNKKALLTFAIFSYNQKQYIREAVEGAFSQTYSPLEIVISDDASSDGTFDVIKEMAASYVGPHTVKIMRGEINVGLINHINRVVKHVSSDFIVMAAGDDISLPWRVSTIAEIIRKDKTTMAIFSEYIEFTDDLKKLMPSRPKDLVVTQTHLVEALINAGGIGLGATYAYHKNCFTWPNTLPNKILSEDRILPLRAAILGRVYKIESPLLEYRKTKDSLTSVLIQSERLPYQSKEHWIEVKNTLILASQTGISGRFCALLLVGVVNLRMLTLSLEDAGKNSKNKVLLTISFALFLPLRAMRKFGARGRIKLHISGSM